MGQKLPCIELTPMQVSAQPNMFEVLGKDTSQCLICNITDMAIMTIWQYRVMGGSAL